MFEIILLGYLDRLRGTGERFITGDTRLLMGWCLAAIYGHEWDSLTLPFVALFAVGESFRWGGAMQAATEGRWTPLLVRGLLWGAPMALLGFWDRTLVLMPIVFATAMPAALWLSRKSVVVTFPWCESGWWERMEYLRGWIIAGISVILR